MSNDLTYTCSIIGANGYIGRHLCHLLSTAGHTVYAYDYSETRNEALSDDVFYAKADVTNKAEVQVIRFDVDYVFVFSGLTGTKVSFDNYQSFVEVNELGLLHILNTVKDQEKIPRVVFPSTRLVYKGSDLPLKENDLKEAKTVYAANKLNCEQLLKTYANQFDIPYTIYRICVPYGNLFDSQFSYGTIGYFLNKAKAGESIVLYGEGDLRRTFTHISSLCYQIIDSLAVTESVNETYNIHGETLSLLQAAELIAKRFNVSTEHIPWPESDLKLESGHTEFNAEKITALLETQKSHSLADWISEFSI